ncbi:PA14 domain-containing protein [Luteolibacter sp. Populi]|uniref:PA14 domain-containing protein n=1 Tax=Luteolibacter sp. Populi TaxID=3230487 RepID=UPI003465D914
MKYSPKVLLAALVSAAGLAAFGLRQATPEASTASANTPATAPRPDQPTPPAVLPPTPPQATDGSLFTDIGSLEKGTTISLPLPDGGTKEARLNYVNRYPNGAQAAGGVLADGSGIFEIAQEPWGYRGFVLQKQDKIAYVYSSNADGELQVARRPIGEVICEPDPNFKPLAQAELPDPEKIAIYNGGRSVGVIGEAIPILNSLPRAEATIYLDFDGEVIEGQSWEGGARIVAPAFNFSAAQITAYWQRVAEDFAPFEVNVSTDLQAYLRAPQGRRMRCITTSNNFAGAGGVAFNNTFLQSGDTCCWNFDPNSGASVVISHEVGHTFGLHHDGRTVPVEGYYSGHGSGNTSWGPNMGTPYSQAVTQWSKGDYVNADQHQDDLAYIGAAAPRRLDDHSNVVALATPLTLGAGGSVSNSGVIESRDDIDRFVFTTAGGSLTLNFTPAPNGPNLDIEAKLYNAAGTLLTTASPANQLNASLSTALAAGTYTVTVDGTGEKTWADSGYDDYGSLGAYTVTGTVPTPSWRFRIAANALNGAALGTVAPGNAAYSITAGNTGTAFAINSATGLISVANAASLSSAPVFTLSIGYTASGIPTTTSVPIIVAPLRGLKQEIWTGLNGSGIGPLATRIAGGAPNLTRYAPIFQVLHNADNYGQRLSGYLLPTETGNHVFWTTADDSSEVWLSTDATPANKVRIAYNTSNTAPDNWTAQGTQQSADIPLVAGQRYYIEVLHRDQTSADHVSVSWQSPTQARRLIGTDYLEFPGALANRAPWLASMTFRIQEGSALNTVVGTLAAGDFEPGAVLSGFTITGGNTGNAFALNATTGILTVNGALSFAALQKYLLDVQVADNAGLTRTAQIAVEVEARAVKREYWTGISGNDVVNLTSNAAFIAGTPTATSYVPFFETPANSADNYGQRLSGYVRPPDSGSYTFWISSDDDSELWLSTTSSPANKVRIANCDGATNPREWGKFPSQQSANITLEGGKSYYMEVLHKEGAGGDNLAVSWDGPNFGRVMLGAPHVTQNFYNHGAPVLNDKSATIFSRDAGVVTTLEAKDWADPGTTLTFSITGGNADGAFTIDPLTGTISAATPTPPSGVRVLTITVTDNGVPQLSDTATVTVNVAKPGMRREVWTGLPDGQALTDLTKWLHFPQAPTLSGYTENFKAPTGYGENYGQRLSAYIIPPATGDYTFWIASDDGGQLLLSTDANPANRKAIASVNGSVGEEQWTAQGNQQSAVIPLVAGQRYYIEALQKEGNGGDHLAAAWQGPGFTRTLISGNNLEYPEVIRPALRREVFSATSPVAWAKNPASGLMEWATSLLSETFEGTGALSGNATETGSATWGASAGWVRNTNLAAKAANGDATALLPFAPVAGKVYTLSLEVDPTTSPGTTDWFALGFISQPATNGALYSGTVPFTSSGAPWMLVRANGNSGGNTVQAFSSATTNVLNSSAAVSGIGTYDTLAVTLDTRGASWISRYYFNSTLVGQHVLSPNPTIQSAGFGAMGTAKGNVRNFRLATADAPAAGNSNTDGVLLSFKSAVDATDNFSERISGFIVPPATGAYSFWIASDDDGELLLSTDETPANLAKIASVTGFVNPEAWDTQPAQKSVLKNLVAGKRYYVEARHRDGIGGDYLAVAWEGPGITRQIVANEYLEHPAVPADRTLLRREVWTGVGGQGVGDLTNLATYPGVPNSSGTLTAGIGLRAGTNVAENFGERISGFLVAPDTGRYTFWIAADDQAELWLATDSHPANRVRIATVNGAVPALAWDNNASQKSVPIALEAGDRYYLEILHKEGAVDDHLAVAWQGPNFARQLVPNVVLEHLYSIPGKANLKREVWNGIAGEQVANLTSNSAFISGTPAARGALTRFEVPPDYADTYGQRISARLVAPESGNFKFWIASDHASELWLSTTSSAANRIKIATTSATTNAREWTKFPTQESGSLPLVAGTAYYIEALHKDGSAADHLAVAWQGPSFARQVIDGRFLQFPGTLPATVALKREVWTGITGEQVTDLTGIAAYPASPSQVSTLNEFSAPLNWGTNYGQKVSGYLIAPRSGDYRFWIASDDGGDLNFAADGVPANKTRIAFTTNATGNRNWTNNANQQSAVIPLVAGQRCYIEALQKEGGGDDYVSVAWTGPDIPQQVIPAQFLEYPGLIPGTTQSGSAPAANPLDPGYAFWLGFNGLITAGNRLATSDPDGDRLSNSLEFVLGGKPSGIGANSTALLPQVTLDPTWATFVYRRADVSIVAGPYVQFGTTLGVWTRAENSIGGVQISITDDAFAPGIDRVTVKVPRSTANLFMRLNAGF